MPEIVEKSELKIHPTKQTIDKPLGLPRPFDDKNGIYVLTGGQGSGKSTWLHSALTCRKKDGKIFAGCFTRVFYATPEEVMDSEENHPFRNHVKTRLFHTFNKEMLENVIEQALEVKRQGHNSLLVIDDFTEELSSLDTIRHLKKIINKHRHYHLSILITSLNMRAIPRMIRSLIDMFVIFKPKGLIEMESYMEEIFGLNKKQMMEVFDFVFDEPHNFLMYNNKTGEFYRNFDRFTIR